MVMGKLVHRQYKKEFAKVGTAITIRKPNKFRATKAQARSNTNLSEPSTTLTVSTQAHVTWAFSSVELTMTIEEYSKRYIRPAANALANQIDVDVLALYKDVYNQVGTSGTTPASFSVLGDAQVKLDNEAAPTEDRKCVVNPAARWSLANALKGTFSEVKAHEMLTKGYLGTIADLAIHGDQNVQAHTTGIFTTSATPVVKTTSSSGDTSIATEGWNASTSTVTDGDVFTVATVNAVNPVSGDDLGVLRQFVCTAAGTADASGDLTISVSPTITSSGAYQTVSALPAAADALTFVGTESTAYPENMVFHPNAFALVTVPMAMPSGVWGARETFNDISLRVVKQYDIDADEEIIRLDVLYGTATLYAELACRLRG